MRKIPCLFVRQFAGRGSAAITREVTPGCEWVLAGEGTASRKWDGTACAVIDGVLHKRYDAKGGKAPPVGAIPCQPAPDPISNHWPHWIPVDATNPADRWHVAAWRGHIQRAQTVPADGTYELIGPAIGGNPECVPDHELVRHGTETAMSVADAPRTLDRLREFLTAYFVEGIVFAHPDGRMCKIRRHDFDLPWGSRK